MERRIKKVITVVMIFAMVFSVCGTHQTAKAATKVTKITIKQGAKATITAGKTKQLTFTLKPTNAKVADLSFTTSNKAIATVSAKGLVKGIKKGTATITAKAKNGTAKATIKFTVNAAPVVATPKPTVKPTPTATPVRVKTITVGLQISANTSFKLTANVEPSNATYTLVWTSSNESIASVSSNGTVTTHKAGKVTVSAVALETNLDVYERQEFQIVVTAPKKKPSTGLKISGKKQVEVKKSIKLKANKKVKWKSSNKKIATVNSKGSVKGIKPGKVTITATTTAKAKKNRKSKKMTIKVVKKKVSTYSQAESDIVFGLINGYRTSSGKAALTVDTTAEKFAKTQSQKFCGTLKIEKGTPPSGYSTTAFTVADIKRGLDVIEDKTVLTSATITKLGVAVCKDKFGIRYVTACYK